MDDNKSIDDVTPKARTNNRSGKKVGRTQFSTHSGHALTSKETAFILFDMLSHNPAPQNFNIKDKKFNIKNE